MLRRLHADHGRNNRLLELEVAIAKERLDGLGVEAARNLLGGRNREFVTRDIGETARLEFVLEGGEFSLGGLQDSVGERFIADVVKAGAGCGIVDVSRDRTPCVRPSRSEAIRRILSKTLGILGNADSNDADDLNASNDE